MNTTSKVVLATVAGSVVAAADAQLVPRCFFWAAPSQASWTSPTVHGVTPFTPIVRHQLATDSTPLDAAGTGEEPLWSDADWDLWVHGSYQFATTSQIAKFFDEKGWITPETMCLLVQNALSKNDPQYDHVATDMFKSGSNELKIRPKTGGCPATPSSSHIYQRVPYLRRAIVGLDTEPFGWFVDFFTWYDAATGVMAPHVPPPPVSRIFMDSEANEFPNMYSSVHELDLFMLQNDCRWDSLSVPGWTTGTGATPATMADLWADYRNGAGSWPLGFGGSSQFPLVDGVTINASAPSGFRFGPYAQQATRIGAWYGQVAQQALAQRFSDVCFDPAKSFWPSVKTLNYDYFTIKPGVVKNGFFQEVDSNGVPPYQQSTPAFSRIQERGSWDTLSGDGWLRQVLAGSAPTNLTSIPRERWNLQTNTKRAGDYSSPKLYAVGGNTAIQGAGAHYTRYLQRNPYRYTTEYPLETRWEASLRNHREVLEAIIESEGSVASPEPWLTIVPWVTAATNNVGVACSATAAEGSCYTLTSDDSNRQLALLKSKNIVEMIVWSDTANIYAPFTANYKQVYEPVMLTCQNTGGNSTLLTTTDTVGRVTDTNPRWGSSGQANHTFDTLTSTHSYPVSGVNEWNTTATASVKVLPRTNYLPAFETDETLRFIVEVEFELTNASGTLADKPTFIGQLRIPGAGIWLVGDAVGSTAFEKAKFVCTEATRESDSTGRRGWIRRTIDVCLPSYQIDEWLTADGTMTCSLVLRAQQPSSFATSGTSLTTKIDLLQVIRAPRSCTGAYQPSDLPPQE
ncbi:MAG TPA: hypothetical protein VF777_06010 [Phycisphaerales bacterium]